MIKLILVGKTRERFLQDGISEFVKRIKRFHNLNIIEIKDSGIEEEGEKILKALDDDYAVILDVNGNELSSEEFAVFIKKNLDKKITFVVGGPEGLSNKVLDKADFTLSLSRMTLTHEMARLFLVEQIYRAFMIINGRGYHK